MKLKELRKSKGLTQQELADILNINNVTYYGYEKGRNEPSFEILIKIADFYGVSLDYLCDHEVKNQVGYLTEIQHKIVAKLKELNDVEAEKTLSYIVGLIDNRGN